MPVGHNIRSEGFNLDSAVKPREIAASTDAPGYGGKVLITNKVTTNFPPTPITPLATTLSTSSTAESRFKETLVIKLCSKIVFYRSTKHLPTLGFCIARRRYPQLLHLAPQMMSCTISYRAPKLVR